MSDIHLSNGLSYPVMRFSEIFKFNPNALSRYLPNTVSHMLSAGSSTCYNQTMVSYKLDDTESDNLLIIFH